jgi:hypothetical protein
MNHFNIVSILQLAPLTLTLWVAAFGCESSSSADGVGKENSGDGDDSTTTGGRSGDGDVVATGSSGGTDFGSGGETSSTGSGSSLGLGGDGTLGCDIQTLFADKCGECHGGAKTFADLDLVSAGVDGRLLDVPSVSCPDWPLVVGGSPERSNLYQKVASPTPPCGERMPLETALSTSETECVADYIRSLAGPDPVPPCETCGELVCIDLQTDSRHCGACDAACAAGQVCVVGVCEGCAQGSDSCGGSCVDLQTDSANCGACGTVCGGGQSCVAGECQCDPAMSVSFASDVQPILSRDCTTGCHEAGNPGPKGGPVSGKTNDPLLSEGGSHAALVGVDSGCGSLSYIEPFQVEQSYLMKKLLGVDMCGGSKMPKGQAPLSQSDLDTVGAWICGGALDN